jgi:arylsulfatase
LLFLSDNGGCAEKMGRQPTTRPARPLATRDGRPKRDGTQAMPGPDDTFIAYGRNWANVSNTPFRMYKHWVHEGGIATPLIAHWPAGIERRGSLEHQPGHVIDLLPTFIALSGAKYPAQVNGHRTTALPGVSLLPALAGKALERNLPIFWEHEGNRAVRAGQWKLVAKGSDGPWELYDVTADRAELHDLSAAHPDRVADMAARWKQWAGSSNVLPLNPFGIPSAD